MSLQINASTYDICCSCWQRIQDHSLHSSWSLWHWAQRHGHRKSHNFVISVSVISKGSCNQETWGKGIFEGKLSLVNKSEPGVVTGFPRYWRLWDISWGELQTESGTSWEKERARVRERERRGGGGKYQSYDVASPKVIGLPFCFGTEMFIRCHRRFEVCSLSFGFIRVAVKRLPCAWDC